MSLYDDYRADIQFSRDFPFGMPSDTWTTKDGIKIKLADMTEKHIKNCMKLVGEDDDWYWKFEEELKRRGKHSRKIVIKRKGYSDIK